MHSICINSTAYLRGIHYSGIPLLSIPGKLFERVAVGRVGVVSVTCLGLRFFAVSLREEEIYIFDIHGLKKAYDKAARVDKFVIYVMGGRLLKTVKSFNKKSKEWAKIGWEDRLYLSVKIYL